MTASERSGWRDEGLSKRHRAWGSDVPAVDLDAILVTDGIIDDSDGWRVSEYDSLEPCALIDYKHWERSWPVKRDANYYAFARLGDRANLPVFIVRYKGDWSAWWVVPINALASSKLMLARKGVRNLENPMKLESELSFVGFLYWLRGRKMPLQIVGRLTDTEDKHQ